MRRLAVLVVALLTLGLAPSPASAHMIRCEEQRFPHSTYHSVVAVCVTYEWQLDGVGANLFSQQVRLYGAAGCADVCFRTGFTYVLNGSGDLRWSASGPDVTCGPCRHTWTDDIRVNTNRVTVGLSGVFYPAGVAARSVDITVRIPADLRGAHRP